MWKSRENLWHQGIGMSTIYSAPKGNYGTRNATSLMGVGPVGRSLGQKQPVLLRGRPRQADSGEFRTKSFEPATELVA